MTFSNQALKIDPNYVLAIVGKGQTFNNELKHDSAFIYADRAIAIDPGFNRSFGLKGYCYLMTGKGDLALEPFFKSNQSTSQGRFLVVVSCGNRSGLH